MSNKPLNRIPHVDGDSFFASCEIAINQELASAPCGSAAGGMVRES